MRQPVRIPSDRLHKPSGQAIVTIGKRMFYLGHYGSVESRAEHARVLAEYQANGNVAAVAAKGAGPPIGGTITVGELLRDYYHHSEQYYVKNGQATNQVRMIRLAFKVANPLDGAFRSPCSGRWPSRLAGPSSCDKGSPGASATAGRTSSIRRSDGGRRTTWCRPGSTRPCRRRRDAEGPVRGR